MEASCVWICVTLNTMYYSQHSIQSDVIVIFYIGFNVIFHLRLKYTFSIIIWICKYDDTDILK